MAAYVCVFRRRRRFFDHADAFEMENDEFRRYYRLSKNVAQSLCD